MSLLSTLSHLFQTKSTKQAKPRASIRLELESLEQRWMPTVTNHGGALMQHVEVQGLYIGNQWSQNATLNSQCGYLEGFLGKVVNSTYMDALTNAGYGVGRGSFSGGKISLASLSSGSTLTDGTIRSWLSAYAANGTLQTPDANRLYVCFVEPNVIVKDASGATSVSDFRGYHGAFASSSGLIHYAVIAYPHGSVNNSSVSFLSDIDSITKTASHEIAEAATDPNIGYSTLTWYDDANNGEIGDINNNRVMYIGGYAMQRVINKNDFVMTPSEAASNRAVNFLLQSNGNFVEVTSSGSTALAGTIVAMSDQSIDNQGHAMVDIVDSSGRSWEYHDTVGWTYLGSGIKSAKSGQGVSYILYTNGNVYEYDDATAKYTFIDSSVTKLDAGTDVQGVNMVDVIETSGNAWEHSDSSGWHFLASGVASISAGRQGISDFVTTAGVAHWHTEGGSDVALASGVKQATAGYDQNGNYMIDLLYTSGAVSQYRTNTGWTTLASSGSGVVSISKAHLGAVDLVYSNGNAWEYGLSGWRFLGTAIQAA